MNMFDVQGIEIRASRDHVFEFLRDPRNLPRWAHAFQTVDDERAQLHRTVRDLQILNRTPEITRRQTEHVTRALVGEGELPLPIDDDLCLATGLECDLVKPTIRRRLRRLAVLRGDRADGTIALQRPRPWSWAAAGSSRRCRSRRLWCEASALSAAPPESRSLTMRRRSGNAPPSRARSLGIVHIAPDIHGHQRSCRCRRRA